MTETAKVKKVYSKTEVAAAAYLRATGRYRSIRHEPIVLRLANGHRYTPDLLLIPHDPAAKPVLVEVKGGYKLHSHQRARLAFDQARIEFPMFAWMWMAKTKDGWSVES